MGIIPGPAPGSSGSAMCQQRGNGASRAPAFSARQPRIFRTRGAREDEFTTVILLAAWGVLDWHRLTF